MGLTARLLALGILACAALPATAVGALAPRLGEPPYGPMAGPVFAGDAIVWGRPAFDGYELVAIRGAQRTITHLVASPLERPTVHLEASEQRVVLGLEASALRAVFTGPVGGPLTKVAGCTSVEECESDPCPVSAAVDVSGDVVAYEDCTGVHVRDLAPDASPAGRDYAGSTRPRVAGSYVAMTSGNTTTVSNWVTGVDAYTVDGGESPLYAYDVQADGKLAFADPDNESLSWASPAEPSAHKVDQWYYGPLAVRIEDDLLAAQYFNPPDYFEQVGPRGYYFDVVGLHPDPPDVGEYPAPRILDRYALDGIDFDGDRLLWASGRCRHAWLRTWDHGAAAPAGQLPAGCPLPRIVPGSAQVDRERHLSLRLECDVPPGPACVGSIRRIGRQGKPLTIVGYSIAEGHAKTIHLPARGSLCRAGRHRVRARVLVQDQVRIVRARGPAAGLPGC